MIIITISLLLYSLGIAVYFLTYLIPQLRFFYFDWFALFIMLTPFIFMVLRLKKTATYKQADDVKKYETLVNFIKRDLDVIPVTGKRAFPGQSFLQVPHLGLIEHNGKDSVLRWGDKKVVLAVENHYGTVEPMMLDASRTLWELGIRDKHSLEKLLLGYNMNESDLELMAKVYLNMMSYDKNHGAYKLLNEWKQPSKTNYSFKPETIEQKKVITTYDNIRDKVDEILNG